MEQNARPFGLRDKIGYAMGDFGNNFTFLFASSFMMLFCTDVLGIGAGVVGTILMLAKVVDAFTDVGMGRICDTFPPTKDGRFRPWIKRMAIPMGISSMLIYQYWVAKFTMPVRIAWVAVTYILWGSFFYTACNIPYGSMASVITNDPKGRASLSTWRTIGATISGLMIGMLTPMFIYGTNESGQQVVVGSKFTTIAVIFGVCATVIYLICYALTTERVQIEVLDKKSGPSVTEVLKDLIKCKPFIIIILIAILTLLGSLLTSAMNSYLYKDYFNNTAVMSLASLTGVLAMLLVAPIATKFGSKYGKKELSSVGTLICSVVYLTLWVMKVKNPYVYLAMNFISGMGLGIFSMLTWAFIGDVIDYQEIKTGQRTDGTVYSIYSFARKLAQAATSGLSGWLLIAIGYVSSTEGITQAQSVKDGIYNCSTLFPGVCYALIFVLMTFVYPLNKAKVDEQTRILTEKRAASKKA